MRPKILVIGQGIAGTLLAFRLQQQGAAVEVWDDASPGASSPVAAGIINPVTGKRFVKSWRFDAFFPFARKTYLELEKTLNINGLWQEKSILRLLGSPEEANDWAARCALPEYADYLGLADSGHEWNPWVQPKFGFGLIRQAARVDFAQLCAVFRNLCLRQGILKQKTHDVEKIGALKKEFDAIVFCEGHRAAQNPLFPDLPWKLAKGEALLIRLDAPHFRPTHMLKKTIALVPVGQGVLWAGGTYAWDFADASPTAEAHAYLQHHIGEMLRVPFEILAHKAAVRPTAADRRPIIMQSELEPKCFIFNGLGTKGALLAPWFAAEMSNKIMAELGCDSQTEMPEI